jgi:hypothetical protein
MDSGRTDLTDDDIEAGRRVLDQLDQRPQSSGADHLQGDL